MLKFDVGKVAKISGLFLLAVVILFFLLLIWTRRKIDNGDMVKWNGQWLTRAEFQKIVPPQVYKVESKNKPEEVYTAFRQALLVNDVETALGLIREEKRELYREAFGDEVKLASYKTLPDIGEIKKLEKDSYENIYSYYYVVNGKNFSIEFIKNKDGYWEIDQI